MATKQLTRRRLLGALCGDVVASGLLVGTVGATEVQEASITFEDFTCHRFEQGRLEESKELMAMPHRDDPADQEYTHFCGHGDGDVEDGGFGSFPDVVQDSGYVRVPPEGRGNPSDRVSGRSSTPNWSGVGQRLVPVTRRRPP